jgi:hypothetical protein
MPICMSKLYASLDSLTVRLSSTMPATYRLTDPPCCASGGLEALSPIEFLTARMRPRFQSGRPALATSSADAESSTERAPSTADRHSSSRRGAASERASSQAVHGVKSAILNGLVDLKIAALRVAEPGTCVTPSA